MAGVFTVVASGTSLLLVLAFDVLAPTSNIYLIAIWLLVLPALFVIGWILILLGRVVDRRRHRLNPERERRAESIADMLGSRRTRRGLIVLVVAGVLSPVVLGAVGQYSITYMNSPTFCGTACHDVMQPQYDAYLRSPHARVTCLDCHCHTGPGGASLVVASKLDGMRQMWQTMTESYDRPVPSPLTNLPPSRRTCENCHSPTAYHGNHLFSRTHYRSDEANTAEVNVLVLHVGGRHPRTAEFEGIHWHANSNIRVQYDALDASRNRIGKISVFEDDVLVEEYFPPDLDAAPVGTYMMDCTECHNRVGHAHADSPDRAVEEALDVGLLDPGLPYLKKIAVPILADTSRSHVGLEEQFLEELALAYESESGGGRIGRDVLTSAAHGLATVYRQNVFPEMRVGWATYPSRRGHGQDAGGCFRCHDEKHKTRSGKSLSQDCELCHQMLAEEEKLADLSEELRLLLRTEEQDR